MEQSPTRYPWPNALGPDAPQHLRDQIREIDDFHVFVPPGGPWSVTLHWAEIDGRLECTGICIRHQDDAEPITTTLWRSFNPQREIDHWRRQRVRDAEVNIEFGVGEPYLSYFKDQLRLAKPRPRRYSQEHYETVAAIYDRAFALGLPPTKYVADEMGATRTQAAKWVMVCRERGLLPPTDQRKARGNPPPKGE